MDNKALIFFGKLFSTTIKKFNLGNGSTWPGHIALLLNKNFNNEILKDKNMTVIVIAGTNGKTTTSKMIQTILSLKSKKIIHNNSGANLLNGIASSLILSADAFGNLKADFAIFEADENSFPAIVVQTQPKYIVLLNLFRDQLDRYGELDAIAQNWQDAIKKLPNTTKLIINADDPLLTYIGNESHLQTYYFGIEGNQAPKLQHASDTTYCPYCQSKLKFTSISFSHLGNWLCPSCRFKHPKLDISESPYYPLSGQYNRYNTLAALLLAQKLGFSIHESLMALENFKPAFGRQEEITYKNRKICILLSQNPTGFNQSKQTITQRKAKTIILILNDKIADGTDVSWIWDIDIEDILKEDIKIIISGERAYDMALRIKYEFSKFLLNKENFHIIENISKAIDEGIKFVNEDDILYILPTYTAMLEVRKILKGRKIL